MIDILRLLKLKIGKIIGIFGVIFGKKFAKTCVKMPKIAFKVPKIEPGFKNRQSRVKIGKKLALTATLLFQEEHT